MRLLARFSQYPLLPALATAEGLPKADRACHASVRTG